KPLLPDRHRDACLNWARTHLRIQDAQWQNVAFSDGARFTCKMTGTGCGGANMNFTLRRVFSPNFNPAVVDQQFGQLSVTVQNLQSFFSGGHTEPSGLQEDPGRKCFYFLGRAFVRVFFLFQDE
ncbi:hypothetical protein CAPTEDRAFT_92121, partial [Capitella teleta]